MTSMKPSKASRRSGPSASEAIRFGFEELTSEDCCRSSFPSDSGREMGKRKKYFEQMNIGED